MSPIRRFAVGMAVAAVAILATAAPASAHDELISSSPAEGEQLATSPESVTLTFSGDLLVLGDSTSGAVVLVVDSAGEDWATGDVTITGGTVTAEVSPDMPEAGYQVRWQVVSEDGHPISGVIPFTIGGASPMAPVASSSASPATASAQAGEQNASEQNGALRVLLIGAGGAAVAAVAFVIYLLFRRRQTAPATSLTDASAEPEL